MKFKELEAIAEGLAPVITRAIKSATAPLIARIEELEDRGLKFCGVHQRAQSYRRGDSVTHKGSLWTALEATNSEPGTGPSWQLSAKGSQQ